jgi:basic membrane lipoprotein Med (substrate-binding protein (PBP1-ABC) superfamily)
MFSFNVKSVLLFMLISLCLVNIPAVGKSDVRDPSLYRIAVFVPGMLEGSPTYEQMDRGVRRAAELKSAKVTTIEGGFNQGEWQDQINALASGSEYNLIVTSNPALNEICQNAKKMFPAQTFLILDGNSTIQEGLVVFSYNHMEQAFLAGVLAAQLTKENDSNDKWVIGMIAGQSYPDMEKSIVPGFEMGMKSIDPRFELDFRIVGNWYDASKASELADSIYSQGAQVILPIAGGANQGVVTSAKKSGKKIIWFDSPGTDISPGIIVGSAIVKQEKAAEETVLAIIDKSLDDGDILKGNISNGYVLLDEQEKGYIKYVSEDIRHEIEYLMEQFKSGRFKLENNN